MPRAKVVFADLDGTLVHFERHFAPHARLERDPEPGKAVFVCGGERRRCNLLPTSTMGPGVVSLRTLELVGELRDRGVHFVYVTGARCSTIEERLPLLAPADAAFAETGGRFLSGSGELDEAWTRKMEEFCGPVDSSKPPLERPGPLWDWARFLDARGYQLDTRSYFFGFRVDLTKQPTGELQDAQAFADLVRARLPAELAQASNLGKFDFFPSCSGKGNAVRHYMALHGFSAAEAVAMFDDENDLPMAEAVGTCFVLQSTHAAVTAAAERNPHWHLARAVGVLAAEEVLSRILADLTRS